MITCKNLNNSQEFNNIISMYNAFLIDIWGVLYDGEKLYKGVLEFLNYLMHLKKRIIFLSNSPSPAEVIAKKLNSLGIETTLEMVLTAGDIVRQQLNSFEDSIFRKLGKKIYHLDNDRNQDILNGLHIHLVDNINVANFVLLTASLEEDEDLNQYDVLLQETALLNIPIICANPDKTAINKNKILYCSGFFAEKYEKMGGTVYYYGKPYLTIYEAAFNRIKKHGSYQKHDILAIGDTPETDIAGANSVGIDSVLVLSGNSKDRFPDGFITESKLQSSSYSINDRSITPTWVLRSF